MRRSSIDQAFSIFILVTSTAAPSMPAPAVGERQQIESETGDSQARAIQQAVTRFEEGRLAEAIAALEPLRSDPAAPPRALAILGGLYAETGRAADALELLEPLCRSEDADPAVLYNAGRAALALNRVEQAEGYLERSLDRAPGSPAARALGLLRGRQERYEDAFILLRPWVVQNPDDTEARLAAAFAALRLDRAPDVEALLSDLPQSNPQVRLLWGELLLLRGDPRGAIATLSPLLDAAPAEMEIGVRRALASAYVAVGESASAVELLSGRAQGRPAVALELALAQFKMGDVEAALSTIEPVGARLLATGDPGSIGLPMPLVQRVAMTYGRLLIHSGRAEESIPALELAIRLRPEEKEAWQALGQALAAVGRTEQAGEALARFQEIAEQEVRPQMLEREEQMRDPSGLQVRKGFDLLAQGEAQEALDMARREARLAPDDARPLMLEASALLHMERPQEAVTAAERALALAPDDPDATYMRGAARIAVQELEGAERDLRRTLELAPGHTPAINDLAVLLIEKGEREEARRLLERALELQPDDPVAKANLERLEGP